MKRTEENREQRKERGRHWKKFLRRLPYENSSLCLFRNPFQQEFYGTETIFSAVCWNGWEWVICEHNAQKWAFLWKTRSRYRSWYVSRQVSLCSKILAVPALSSLIYHDQQRWSQHSFMGPALRHDVSSKEYSVNTFMKPFTDSCCALGDVTSSQFLPTALAGCIWF